MRFPRDRAGIDRRNFLRAAGAVAATALVPTAGCSGGGTPTPTATPTPTPRPPGLNVLGGPDDLQSEPELVATQLASDQGGGTYVFDPSIAWVETGAQVTWNIRNADHSITAYHPDNDHSLRIPDGAASFDSGILSSGDTFSHTFETAGVYNYFCLPHESLGMVGLVIAGSPGDGPGTQPPSSGVLEPARERLRELLEIAGVLEE